LRAYGGGAVAAADDRGDVVPRDDDHPRRLVDCGLLVDWVSELHTRLASTSTAPCTADWHDIARVPPSRRQHRPLHNTYARQPVYHHRNRFANQLMVSAGVLWNGKAEIFISIDPHRSSARKLTLTF